MTFPLPPSSHPLPKPHIIIATLSLYGHFRPGRILAHELSSRGYAVTFITGSVNRGKIAPVPGRPVIAFVSLKGKSNFDPDRYHEEFPGRPADGGMTALFDCEKMFFAHGREQFEVLEATIAEIEGRGERVVLVQDASFIGSQPMLLDSPLARRVPVIALGHLPLMVLSKDTAPFGPGLPSQGEEVNMKMNAGAIEMFSGIQALVKKNLEPYQCRKELKQCRQLGLASGHLLPAVPSSSGVLAQKPHPEWWDEFIVNNTSDPRPLIVVTSGSLPDLNVTDLIAPTIRACADLPVRLAICAVHIERPSDLILPSNTRWAQWIAFEEIFPYTSLVVSSGGYGGISQALASGIPMILAGTTEDKVETALRAEATGAAINLRTQTPSEEQIRESVKKMLNDGIYKARAEEMEQAFKECDAVGSVVGAIEELTERFYGAGGLAEKKSKLDSGIATPAELAV